MPLYHVVTYSSYNLRLFWGNVVHLQDFREVSICSILVLCDFAKIKVSRFGQNQKTVPNRMFLTDSNIGMKMHHTHTSLDALKNLNKNSPSAITNICHVINSPTSLPPPPPREYKSEVNKSRVKTISPLNNQNRNYTQISYNVFNSSTKTGSIIVLYFYKFV